MQRPGRLGKPYSSGTLALEPGMAGFVGIDDRSGHFKEYHAMTDLIVADKRHGRKGRPVLSSGFRRCASWRSPEGAARKSGKLDLWHRQ